MTANSRRRPEEAAWLLANDAVLRVTWWRDSRATLELGGDYGRRFWLPVIGPTSYLLAETLADALTRTCDATQPVVLPAVAVAESLGIGGSRSVHAPLVRSLTRLTRLDLVAPCDDVLAVRNGWPLLSPRERRRLPGWLAIQHAEAVARR